MNDSGQSCLEAEQIVEFNVSKQLSKSSGSEFNTLLSSAVDTLIRVGGHNASVIISSLFWLEISLMIVSTAKFINHEKCATVFQIDAGIGFAAGSHLQPRI